MMALFAEVVNPKLASFHMALPNGTTCWWFRKDHFDMPMLYRCLATARARPEGDALIFAEWEKLIDWSIRRLRKKKVP